ncbi:MAG: glycosyltransferase family 2 protein [Parcubacteria group bacterium]|nr:glycosyltransferase family 2 protein [Parcubacteria group bacterium]
MISVVTVNYKTIDYTIRMLESLFKYHKDEVEVFVVENDSGDDLTTLKKTFPQVKVIESFTNLGFAGGCNLGIDDAKGEYIVLVNPDILFDNDALYQIEREMNNAQAVGIGGVSLKNLDGSQQASVWSFPRPIDQLLLLLKVNHIAPNLAPLKRWLRKEFDYSRSQDVDQVMGAFFCIRRELLDQIGKLDDGFFIWYEEVDYCRRTVLAGWRVRYFKNISARHKRGSSFDKVATIEKQAILRKSIRRYMRKHHGPLAWVLFILGEPVFWCMSFVASLVKPK